MFDNGLVIPVEATAVISGRIVNVGNVYESVIDADAPNSTPVVNGGDTSGVQVSSNVTAFLELREGVDFSVAEVSVDSFEATAFLGLGEAVSYGLLGLNTGAFKIPAAFSGLSKVVSGLNAFGVRTLLAELEAFVDIGVVSEVSLAFGIKEF